MCDTMVVPAKLTRQKVALFGKNSDRERNEAQAIEIHPAADHPPGAELKCTYIQIPQVRRTYALLLSRPFWMWGAEMGANEHGVAIGNEAVHARLPPVETPSLLGMDLLRLALERSATAAEALEVITVLLERYGQGGNCGHLTVSFYHNSFLIADPTEAYVLETMGRHWLVEQVHGARAISNGYSIGQRPSRLSTGLRAFIREAGWSTEESPNYADSIADARRDGVNHCRVRCARSTSLLSVRGDQLETADMIAILRDHGDSASARDWNPEQATTRTICMHASEEELRGQTVGSLVSELDPMGAVHWVTGTAAPCLSVFKPVLVNASLPPHGPIPTDRFEPQALWWYHERFHRAALVEDFSGILRNIRQERDQLEQSFRGQVQSVLAGGNLSEQSRVIANCWNQAIEAEDRWFALIERGDTRKDTPYRREWRRINCLAGMNSD